MTGFPWQTRANVQGLVIPVWASIGITESHTLVDKTDNRRSLNGTSVQLRPLYGTIYKISLTASGAGIRWSPSFANLPKEGPFTFDCTKHIADDIPAGQSGTILSRDPVPGSKIRVFRKSDGEEIPVPVAVAGRRVSLPLGTFADEDLSVQFLARLVVVLIGWSEAGPEIEGRAEWSLELEEYRPS